jgi:hypothetical protein
MSLRFVVKQAFRIAGVDTVTGILESGTLRHGVAATAQTRQGPLPILIRTVAFVDPPKTSSEYTLTIADPGFALSLLNGATIVEAESTPPVDPEGNVR